MTINLRPGNFFGRPTQRRTIDQITIAETHYSDGMPRHVHESAHFCLVLGKGYVEESGRPRPKRSRGDLVFYPAGVTHPEIRTACGHCLLIDVGIKPLAAFNSGEQPDRTLDLRGTEVVRLAQRVLRELRGFDEVSHLAIQGLVLEMLALSLRVEDVRCDRAVPSWLEALDEILRARFREPLGLDELADELGVHRSHLSRAYRRFHNRTIGDRIRSLRLEFAQDRLLESSDSLASIAALAGFADQAHFTRSLRAATGLTPRRYRAAYRKD